MTKINVRKCKNCGEEFEYDQEAYKLKSERGESIFLRCPNCRRPHGKEIRNVKIPYFTPKRIFIPKTNLIISDYTLRGELFISGEVKVGENWELTIGGEEIVGLYEKLEENQVVVVVSPTGTGKSTAIPRGLIFPPAEYDGDFVDMLIRQGQIIITQPRILATKKVPQGIATTLGSDIGPDRLISLRYSEEDLSSRWNLAVSITDGTLPNWMREGKLGEYSLIMVDEAHERSCNIDLILGLLRRELPKYPQLRVIISSATINTEKFLSAFRGMNVLTDVFDLSFLSEKKEHKNYIHFWKDSGAYILSERGILEPTEDCKCWLCQKSLSEKEKFWENYTDNIRECDLPEIISAFVSEIVSETEEGDILAFLHGELSIEETIKQIKKSRFSGKIKTISAYRRVQEETEKGLSKETNKRKVIVGTNLMETSITIDGAVYGIESGYIKEAMWDPDTKVFTLPTEFHSKDGRKQRWGRLGRTQNGYVYNLYTRDEFEKSPEHTLPEITRSCLEDSLVNLKGFGITEVEQFPWMEEPSDYPDSKMAKEIKRSQELLEEREVVDQKGEITERALALMHIPRSSDEASFLFAADEQGILFESVVTLWFMSTRDGDVIVGPNLYTYDKEDNYNNGLFIWNFKWEARTKNKVWAIHQGLRTGCRDDLDFVVKLATCFKRAQENQIDKEWAKRYFINYDNLSRIILAVDGLIVEIFGEDREDSLRYLEIDRLDKVRSLISNIWSDKIVNLNPGEPITYQIGEDTVGVVSPHCVGNWQAGGKAIAAIAVERQVEIGGDSKRLPVASFMICLSEQILSEYKPDLFIDQKLPIDSWVDVKEAGEELYLFMSKEPPGMNIYYRKTVDFSGESSEEDYSEEDSLKEKSSEEKEEIPFSENFLVEEPLIRSVKGAWIDKRKAKEARIVGWEQRDGEPFVSLSSFDEIDARALGKEENDTLEVEISKVFRDPLGRGGWILARTKEGLEVPIELSEMSLSFIGQGIEQIEGDVLDLFIEEIGIEDGFPKLSNIRRITKDLSAIRRSIDKNRKPEELLGFIENIDEEEGKILVVIEREDGVLHPLEVNQDYVLGKNINELHIGEEVIAHLRFRDRDPGYEAPISVFNEKEKRRKPNNWEIKGSEGKLLVPFCVADGVIQEWIKKGARLEVADFVKRNSWRYCLLARIVDKDTEKNRILDNIQELESHVERWESNIERWQGQIKQAQDRIRRVAQNLEKNKIKMKEAWNEEWKNRYITWISTDENKILENKRFIRNCLDKIESTREKIDSVDRKMKIERGKLSNLQ